MTLAFAAVVATGAAGTGCAPTIQRATDAAIDGSLDSMAEKDNLQSVNRILTSPEIKEAGGELTAAVVAGVLSELAKPEFQEQLIGTSGALGTATQKVIAENISPAIAVVVREAVHAAMTEALANEHRSELRQVAAQMADAAVSSTMRAMATGLEQEVGPAAARTLERDLGPALVAQLQKPELHESLGNVAHTLSYSAVKGTTAAVTDMRAGEGAAGEALDAVGTGITFGWAALVAFSVALAIALIVMAIMLLKGSAQRRHLEQDARQRERMMTTLMHAVLTRDASPEERAELLRKLGLDDDQGGDTARGSSESDAGRHPGNIPPRPAYT